MFLWLESAKVVILLVSYNCASLSMYNYEYDTCTTYLHVCVGAVYVQLLCWMYAKDFLKSHTLVKNIKKIHGNSTKVFILLAFFVSLPV